MASELAAGGFLDSVWLEKLDVVFASYYLDALDSWNAGKLCPGPWQVAFEAASHGKIPALRHVLLGMNAHINFDLPMALLATVGDEEFSDPVRIAARERDHTRINVVLLGRIAQEDNRLARQKGGKTLWERVKQPLERAAARHFLKEARAKVWANAKMIAAARANGDTGEFERLHAELGRRSTGKLRQLVEVREVLLQLWLTGFGVLLEGATPHTKDRPRTA